MRHAGMAAAVTVCVGLIVGLAADAVAQDTISVQVVGVGAQDCPEGSEMRGDLGIARLDCNCVYHIREGGERAWRFRSEPVILEIREDGVAEGKLREGDVITAIDGLLITTSEAGRRYASVEPGDQVTLTVRRGERIVKVEIEAGRQCERVVSAPEAFYVVVKPEALVAVEPEVAVDVEVPELVVVAPEPVVADVEVAPVLAVEPVVVEPEVHILLKPTAFPTGWFGFGIKCKCTVATESPGSPPVWSFDEPPEVSSVERGSPADEAGLRRGDVLLEIDGVPLTSDEGGRRFGAVKAGQTVTFTYGRGGATHEVTLTAAERMVPHPPPPPEEEVQELMMQLEQQQARQQALTELLISQAQGLEFADELAELLTLEADTLALAQELSVQELLTREMELQEGVHLDLERLMANAIEAQNLSEALAEDALRSDQLRFTGTVGDVDIEVRGGNSVITTVVEEGREIVIVTRDARITIRRSK